MNDQELNEYIYNYYKNDLTNSVMLLTGLSGTGKGHYLRTSLIPYLNNAPEQVSCIQISLSDISTPAELSRSIFMEKRVKTLKSKEELSQSNDNGIEKRTREFMKKNKNEAGAVGTIVAKTLLKNIEHSLKVDLEPEEEDKDDFYKSINLAGTLIIFEDAGSTAMDRNELLDYIAGLIDQDGVKVLVVLHADCDAELIKEISKRTSVNIIRYQADVPFIIKGVFDKYDHPVLRSLETEETIEEIVQCGREFHNRNIHAFFSACQKAVDVYRLMNTDTIQYDPDFLKTVFMGMLYYLARKRKGESVFWKDEDQLSFRLGGDRYPLFRFCYDFIMEGTMESDQIKKAQEVLRQFREYDEKTRSVDPDLGILYSWYYQKEQDVADVVARITERLKDPDAFALQEYGRIASCMLKAEELLGCDISEAKELLVSNLTAKGMQVNSDFISRYLVPSADDLEAAAACDALKKKMLDALKKVDAQLFGFSYNPDEVEDFSRQIPELKERIFHFGAFARTMHNGKLAEMIQHCSAKQIYDFHNAYAAVYRIPNSSAYLSGDWDSVLELSEYLKELEQFEGYDRIQKKNLQDFIRDLDRIAHVLAGN